MRDLQPAPDVHDDLVDAVGVLSGEGAGSVVAEFLGGNAVLRETSIEGVAAYRANAPTEPTVVSYRLGICLAVQGVKRVHFGGRDLDYGPLNCLLVGLPLPLQAQVVEASPEAPCLAMVLDLEPAVVRSTARELDEILDAEPGAPAIDLLPVRGALLDSMVRLARAAAVPSDGHMLGESLKREVVYRVLQSEQGAMLRSLAAEDSSVHRVEQAVRYMNDHLASPVSVAQLADLAHMSQSLFHQAFKRVTSLSPLQYLKRIRLQAARALMMDSALNASEAAHEVGYKSASQFSREFKALYGVPPSRVRSI